MIEKSTVHKFVFYEASVEVAEYPHDRPGEGRTEIKMKVPSSISFWQGDDGDAYIDVADNEGFYAKISGKHLYELLEPSLKWYAKRCRELGYDKPKSKK